MKKKTALQKIRSSRGYSEQGSREHAEKIHKKLCLLCVADAKREEKGEPGLIEEVKEMYFRWQSPSDIEEDIGYYEKEVPAPTKADPNRKKVKKIPYIPEKTIRRHANFYGWPLQRGNNTENILAQIVDIGMNQALSKQIVGERLLAAAIDMQNKMKGNYFKPQRNPRDIRSQMKATVESVLARHKELGEGDVDVVEVIDALSKRPGFEHIKIILKDDYDL